MYEYLKLLIYNHVSNMVEHNSPSEILHTLDTYIL